MKNFEHTKQNKKSNILFSLKAALLYENGTIRMVSWTDHVEVVYSMNVVWKEMIDFDEFSNVLRIPAVGMNYPE